MNNTIPVAVDLVDKITEELSKCTTSRALIDDSPSRSSTSKKRKSRNLRERAKRVDYFLFPIGSATPTAGSQKLPKWTDVASIIEQGTFNHRSLDERTTSSRDFITTISSGTLSSMLAKTKSYAVHPIHNPMVNMKPLMDTNVHTRLFVESHAKFVCMNILMALRFLHQHKIFHGAISPKKIVFNERCYPCLSGFGAAEIIDERQSRPRERWEPAYITPEQLFTEHITEVADMWSTACLTYAMIYGRPPHEGPDAISTRRNILDKRFEPLFAPEHISPAGRRFIMKCIRKRESRRYSILDAKDAHLNEAITWFAGLNEDRLYKQTVPSPLAKIVRQHAT